MAGANGEPPDLTYEGSWAYPICAAVSLLGTTSFILSVVLFPQSIQGSGSIHESVHLFLLLFFLAALVVGIGGGLTLALFRKVAVCKLSVRGRNVPEKALQSFFVLCYSAPWLTLAVMYVFGELSR